MDYVGEIAGVGAAFFWALCGLAFAAAGRRIGASAVNQIRIYAAVVVLGTAHAIAHGAPWPASLSDRQLQVLILSGVVGLALGDLCLFRCMTLIGPRYGAVLMATAPAMTAVLAALFLGERLATLRLCGIAMVTVGVMAVLLDPHTREGWQPPAGAGTSRAWPIALGLIAALGQALGVLLSKIGMDALPESSELGVEPLPATLVRMVGAAAGVLAIAVLGRQIGSTLRAFGDRRALAETGLGTVTGPILGVWASMVAVKYADAGVAATLMALAPVFLIPIGRVAYGARAGRLGVLGTLVAVGGTALLF